MTRISVFLCTVLAVFWLYGTIISSFMMMMMIHTTTMHTAIKWSTQRSPRKTTRNCRSSILQAIYSLWFPTVSIHWRHTITYNNAARTSLLVELLWPLLVALIHTTGSNTLCAITAKVWPVTFRASWSIMTLCGLISRCMMPWLWQYSNACTQLLHVA